MIKTVFGRIDYKKTIADAKAAIQNGFELRIAGQPFLFFEGEPFQLFTTMNE